jgi:hypothetical protein
MFLWTSLYGIKHESKLFEEDSTNSLVIKKILFQHKMCSMITNLFYTNFLSSKTPTKQINLEPKNKNTFVLSIGNFIVVL